MRRRAIAEREIEKRHRKYWEKFISHLESDIWKIKPHASKLQKHMDGILKNQQI